MSSKVKSALETGQGAEARRSRAVCSEFKETSWNIGKD